MWGKKGGSGLLLRLEFPVLRVLLLYLLVEMFLPVNVCSLSSKALQIPRFRGPALLFLLCLWLEILSLGMAPEEASAGPHGPELLRPKLIPSKPKCKAKAKSKDKIGAGLRV